MSITVSPTLHKHIPILVKEILAFADEIPQGINSYLDGTFGRGGHLRAVLQKFSHTKALAVDKDLAAITFGHHEFDSEIKSERLQILHSDYTAISELINSDKTDLKNFDMILLDLGISSPQVDQADRGFSFMQDGPLDMRMNQKDLVKASDIINGWTEEELKNLFFHLGEVRSSGRVVRAIIQDRQEKPFLTTRDLAGLIERVEGWKKKGFHPATQYFMALRIQVNSELEPLAEALKNCISLLSNNGRLFVISFHSLEDRIVKTTFLESSEWGFQVNKKIIVPSDEEQKINSRSRSAKLRIFQRSLEKQSPHGKKDKYAHKKGQ